MRRVFQKIGNVALVIGGFFVVFFGAQKFSSSSGQSPVANLLNSDSGIAFADAPSSAGSAGDSAGGGDSGSGSDSGGGGK